MKLRLLFRVLLALLAIACCGGLLWSIGSPPQASFAVRVTVFLCLFGMVVTGAYLVNAGGNLRGGEHESPGSETEGS